MSSPTTDSLTNLKSIMATMEQEVEVLVAQKRKHEDELSALDAATERYNVAIEAIANLLHPNEAERRTAKGSAKRQGSPNKQRFKEAVLRALRTNKKPMRLHDLWAALHAHRSTATKAYTDKIVTEMRREGTLIRPGRGLYDLDHKAEKAKTKKVAKAMFDDAAPSFNVWNVADKIMQSSFGAAWTTLTLQEALIKKLGRPKGFVHTRKIGNYFRRRMNAQKVSKYDKGKYKWRSQK